MSQTLMKPGRSTSAVARFQFFGENHGKLQICNTALQKLQSFFKMNNSTEGGKFLALVGKNFS